jgi:uncharacterized phage protein (TIGR01671 family)
MRGYKFRIWYNKKMEYSPELEFTKTVGGDYIIRYIDALGFCVATSYEEGELIIEINIGLQDKNGKEIYEGDIIQTDELGWRGYCVYNHDRFMLIDNEGGFSEPTWKNCKVIGNIHEDKEMLKRSKRV